MRKTSCTAPYNRALVYIKFFQNVNRKYAKKAYPKTD